MISAIVTRVTPICLPTRRHMLLTALCATLCAVCLFTVMPAAAQDDDPDLPQTFTSADGALNFDTPDGWRVEEADGFIVITDDATVFGGLFVMTTREAVNNVDDDLTLGTYTKAFTILLFETGTLTVDNPMPLLVGDNPAIQMMSPDGDALILAVDVGDAYAVFLVIFETGGDTMTENTRIFQAIAATLTFTE